MAISVTLKTQYRNGYFTNFNYPAFDTVADEWLYLGMQSNSDIISVTSPNLTWSVVGAPLNNLGVWRAKSTSAVTAEVVTVTFASEAAVINGSIMGILGADLTTPVLNSDLGSGTSSATIPFTITGSLPSFRPGSQLLMFAGSRSLVNLINNEGYTEYAPQVQQTSASAWYSSATEDTTPSFQINTSYEVGTYFAMEIQEPVVNGAILTVPTAIADTTTSLRGTVTTSGTDGTLYWYVSQSAVPPTAIDHKAGTGADSFGSQPVISTGLQTIASMPGLTLNTDYYVHYLHADISLGDSSPVTTNLVRTLVQTVTIPVITGGANLVGLDYMVLAGQDLSTATILLQGSGATTDDAGTLIIDLSTVSVVNGDLLTVIIGDWTIAPTDTNSVAVCYAAAAVG